MRARGASATAAARTGPTVVQLPVTAGDLRLRWQGRFGPILIEVIDGQIFVNGGVVESADSGGNA